jgi:hypothetical protein
MKKVIYNSVSGIPIVSRDFLFQKKKTKNGWCHERNLNALPDTINKFPPA